ncbi:S8 family peptidase [Crocinitomix catalasitica]|uniref:S8 family peptidase n=1 Tax=Crocinitomix catalasitica TaxID=184607 RepID=UPI000A07B70D|nr:S8 family peptidase [Crocinitomix catalasitica]
MRLCILLLANLFYLNSIGQTVMSNNCKMDIELLMTHLASNNQQPAEQFIQKYPIHKINGISYLSTLAETDRDFDASLLKGEGYIIGSQINKFISLKVPFHLLDKIETLEGIKTIQLAGKIKPDLHKVRYDTHVDSIHKGIGLPEIYSGKDIIIGVTDWGFDYSSPMFYDTLLEATRIIAAWDQFKTSGPNPVDYAYGTEFNSPATLIAAGSDTANIYSYGTHGTHVAGIAGGSGAGTNFRGMAYEAQFLFVTFFPDEGAVLDAWEWMYNKAVAEDKRLVINMSWGLYHTGALDGTSILSQALDSYSDLGVTFVTSGGNNGSVNFHIKKEFTGDTLYSKIEFYESEMETLYGQSIHAWGDSESSFTAGFNVLNISNEIVGSSEWYSTAEFTDYIESYIALEGDIDTVRFNLSMDDAYPTNDRPQMRLRIKNPIDSYKIILKSTHLSGTVHFWNVTELTSDVGNWGMPFTRSSPDYVSGDNEYGVGAPACSHAAISVAAHAAEYAAEPGDPLFGGGAASFSSNGPLITGEIKPDISAPGVNVTSSISSYTDDAFGFVVSSVDFEGRTYDFARFSGTSMSGPAVAGICALILDANPYLSPDQVKEIIIETARLDRHTGEIGPEGSTSWGWGKIDAYDAIRSAITITGLDEITKEYKWKIYPNPTNSIVNIGGDLPGLKQIEIIDLNGKVCLQSAAQNTIAIDQLSPGIYICKLLIGEKVEQQKFIVQ